MEPLMTVTDLTVGYEAPVVTNLSFSVEAGEIVGLLGRNGSGKTTLLRGLTGTAPLIRGEAAIRGVSLLGLRDRQRARLLSLLPQRTALLPGFTAGELIAMGNYAARTPFRPRPGQLSHQVRDAARRFGIETLLDTDCAQLSEGQRQLVYLARSVVQDASVLLLDEPNSALDYAHTHLVFQQLRRLITQEKKGALVVLHDPGLALRWCSRIVLLEEGGLSPSLSVPEATLSQAEAFLRRLYPTLRLLKDRETGCLLPYLP